MAPPSNALALAALVLGILANGYAAFVGFVYGAPNPLAVLLVWLPTVVPGLLGIIFGFVGVTTANRLGGKRKAYAVWGIVLGFAPVVTLFLASLVRSAFTGT